MNLGKRAEICRVIVLVYLGWLIVSSLFGLEHACAESNFRGAAFFLLVLGLRYWLFVAVARPMKVWVAVQGVAATVVALANLGARWHGVTMESLATVVARVSSASPERFWVFETVLVITAVCSWILFADLKRLPPWKPAASAVS